MFQSKKIIAAGAFALFAGAGLSLSAQSDITVAMQLEPVSYTHLRAHET